MTIHAHLDQEFSQGNSSGLYLHVCRHTGKWFYSPFRHYRYSSKGRQLIDEHNRLVDEAKTQVCRVYFYKCPETNVWHTSRTPGARRTGEGRAIAKQRNLEKARLYRQREEVKQRELGRGQKRVEYMRQYHAANKDIASERYRLGKAFMHMSCKVYFNICEETGLLFTTRVATARFSKQGLRLRGKRRCQHNRVLVNPTLRRCARCGDLFSAKGSRLYCSTKCANSR